MRIDPQGTARARLFEGERALPDDVADEQLFLAEELVGMVHGLAPEEESALARLVLATLVASSRGSTRLPFGGRHRPLFRQLLTDAGAADGEADRAEGLLVEAAGRGERLAPLFGAPGDYRPLVLDGPYLYHQRLHELERRIAGSLAPRLAAPADVLRAHDGAIADVEAAPPILAGQPMRLSDAQRKAVRAALARPLTVIAGGPGTGKTAIIMTLLRALVRLDVPAASIALAAPTGKAADRMRSSIESALRRLAAPGLADLELFRARPEPRTLHRLLGWSPRRGRFRHHRQNPLAEQVVIVDESSMIDLALMEQLLSALAAEARLVLLGDADQLPSVEAGAVFRDLAGLSRAAPVRLEKSFRMDPTDPDGRAVFTIARRINRGDGRGCFEPHERSRDDRSLRVETRASAAELAFRRVELVSSRSRDGLFERWLGERMQGAEGHDGRVRRWYRLTEGGFHADDTAELEKLFREVAASQLLCVTRGRATGVVAVNNWFHARALQEATRDDDAAGGPFVRGEPVLVERNDYDKGLFNGDTGVVLGVVTARGEARRAAVFRRDDAFLVHPLEAVRSIIAHAYAITVHKAQGSEHDCVALVLPETDTRLLTREVLYTAVSRARRSVVLCGSRDMVELAASRRMERFTGLSDRL